LKNTSPRSQKQIQPNPKSKSKEKTNYAVPASAKHMKNMNQSVSASGHNSS